MVQIKFVFRMWVVSGTEVQYSNFEFRIWVIPTAKGAFQIRNSIYLY